jgi:hypothetical protein
MKNILIYIILCVSTFFVTPVFSWHNSNTQYITKIQYDGNGSADIFILSTDNWTGGNRTNAMYGMVQGTIADKKGILSMLLFAYANNKKVTLVSSSNQEASGGGG